MRIDEDFIDHKEGGGAVTSRSDPAPSHQLQAIIKECQDLGLVEPRCGADIGGGYGMPSPPPLLLDVAYRNIEERISSARWFLQQAKPFLYRYRHGSEDIYRLITPPCSGSKKRSGGGRRKEITGFSSQSRRRMIQFNSTVDWFSYSYRYFITLTASRDLDRPDLERILRILRQFGSSGVWRKEKGDGDSPKVHYHILCGSDSILGSKKDRKAIAYRIQRAHFYGLRIDWTIKQIRGFSTHGCHIKHLEGDIGLLLYYTAKYLSKEGSGITGRSWGVFGFVPRLTPEKFDISWQEWGDLLYNQEAIIKKKCRGSYNVAGFLGSSRNIDITSAIKDLLNT